MPEPHIRVVCQQLAPTVDRPRESTANASVAIAEATAMGADLVVLPELVVSGYVFRSRDEVLSRALAPSSPVFDEWSALLRPGAVVVGGFPEIGSDGVLYNSAAVVDHEGLRAVYRKTHLWDAEKLWFTPGDEPPPVVDTWWGRLGVLICYDLEFPEMTRGLALRGADVIAAPTNWPRSAHPPGERPVEISDVCSMARLNGVHIACCDRVGDEREVEWTGGSCVIDHRGWVLDERTGRDVGAVTAEVVPSAARDKALNDRNDLLGDRRPTLYADLVVGGGLGVDS